MSSLVFLINLLFGNKINFEFFEYLFKSQHIFLLVIK